MRPHIAEIASQKALGLNSWTWGYAGGRELRIWYESRFDRKQETEITALFTGGAAVLSLIAGTLSLLWFNRLP